MHTVVVACLLAVIAEHTCAVLRLTAEDAAVVGVVEVAVVRIAAVGVAAAGVAAVGLAVKEVVAPVAAAAGDDDDGGVAILKVDLWGMVGVEFLPSFERDSYHPQCLKYQIPTCLQYYMTEKTYAWEYLRDHVAVQPSQRIVVVEEARTLARTMLHHYQMLVVL